MNIVLFEPEIPPNTGNIIRLCANSGVQLHLIKPLGFDISDKRLRRAGLDYHEFTNVQIHDDFAAFRIKYPNNRLLALTTKGETKYSTIQYGSDDILLFGPETRGLPADILQSIPKQHWLRIPMVNNSRSLNLSNATAIILYEAWRQQGFIGGN